MFMARVFSAAVLVLAVANSSQAQTYKDGESVEVLYLGRWYPAVVIDTNKRGEIMAEFTFAVNPMRQLFKKDAVRAEYESGAIARGRNWSDPSGTFKIKAALLSMNDDELLLRKTDLTEVRVSLGKLSEGDKKFIKDLQKSMGLVGQQGPQPPPIETFDSYAAFGSSMAFGSAQGRPAITPDALPPYIKLKQGGCGFLADDVFDKLGAVFPVGGPDQWLLAAVENEKHSATLPTRLYWVSLARRKVENRQLLPPEEQLLDYHAPSQRVLTYTEIKDGAFGKGALTIWETKPTADKVKPVVRWYCDNVRLRVVHPWGRLIDGNLVLQRADRQRYVVWDIAAKQAKYEINQESFFAPDLVLSGNRKQVFIPEDNGVRVLNVSNGEWLTNLPTKDGCSGVAVSEDGRRLATLGRSTLLIWDLTTADAPPEEYQAEAIGTPFTAKIAWVGDDRIMAQSGWGQNLFSLRNKLTLWHYEFDHHALSDTWGERVREIVDRHLVYAATVRDGPQHGLAVGAVQLPGPRVDEMEARLDRELLYVVKPGVAVRLEVNAGEFTDKVTSALEAKIRENGWTIAPGAPIVIQAEMKRGEMQTVNYRLHRGIQELGTQSATLVPYISSLKVLVGDQTAWWSTTASGAPSIVRLKEGEAVQDEVDKWQKPRPEFFDTVKIPQRILDPKYKNGLGTTMVTNRGLIPKN
jgi:hypothetical protein